MVPLKRITATLPFPTIQPLRETIRMSAITMVRTIRHFVAFTWGAPNFSTTYNERVPAISPGCAASSACLSS